jgi:hypothetical protein
MRLLANASLVSRAYGYLLGTVPGSQIDLHWPQSGSIAWNRCADVDFGFDEDDLLHPIQCARLTVPLDYTNLESQKTTEVQVLRVPAAVTPSRGSVIINPGGPGQSGCDYLAMRSSRFHAFVGIGLEDSDADWA